MLIEQAKNGFIIREDEEKPIVFQSEYGSINHALCAMLDYIKRQYESEQDVFKVAVKIDTALNNVANIK